MKGRALQKAPGKHPKAINWGIQVVGGRLRFGPNGRQMLQVFLQAGCESRTLVLDKLARLTVIWICETSAATL